MKIEEIARVAHEVNRAYCTSIGDTSQVPWEEAPEWQRESAIDGVRKTTKKTTPGDSHRSWLELKEKEGWTYGETKDPDNKTHPCMVPFEELPSEQQTKDYLFLSVVQSLMYPDNDTLENKGKTMKNKLSSTLMTQWDNHYLQIMNYLIHKYDLELMSLEEIQDSAIRATDKYVEALAQRGLE
tara:strand:+ start:203 stop:751 length:549 start_codon:yes stop_codon:yes gene_type:complete